MNIKTISFNKQELEKKYPAVQETYYELFLDFGENIGTQTIYTSERLEDCEKRKSDMINNLDKYYTNDWQGLPKDVVSINIDTLTMTFENREVTKLKDR